MKHILIAGLLSLGVVSSALAGPLTFEVTFDVVVNPGTAIPDDIGLSGSTWTFTQVYPDSTFYVDDFGAVFAGGAMTTLTIAGSAGGAQDGTFGNVTGTAGIDIFGGFEGLFVDNLTNYNFPGFMLPSGDVLEFGLSLFAPASQPNIGDAVQTSDFGLIQANNSSFGITRLTGPNFFEQISYNFANSNSLSSPIVTGGPTDGNTPPPQPPTAVPEPSTFVLLGIGGIALVGYCARRKRQQAA
ncbi:MAG: PEP-CTERM sorting domain-containing protein [Pseudomonadales bacterium]|nr:PEP-CTERM sorting domain-containing protein [Pseudomonadales bacterium]